METATALQNVSSSYIREILHAVNQPGMISLAGGLPDESTFPLALIQPALAKIGTQPELFQYGNTAGYAPLLTYLHDYFQLPETYQAMITTGSQQGLDLIARSYINPGDKIVMEAPSYLGAMQVFGLAQADIVPVTQNTQGPDVEELEQCFIQHAPKLFYAVPDFHNPTGVCWSLTTRQKVAELCQHYAVTLIEDAPYREIRFSGNPLPMVSSFCPDHAIVLRSFSKLVAPGMRLGMVAGPATLIQPLLKVKQGADLHSSVPMQALLLALLTHPELPNYTQAAQALYLERYQKMASELQRNLPDGCHFTPIEGGMFIWLTLPDLDSHALAKTLLTQQVAVVPSAVFYPPNYQGPSAVRLNFTRASLAELEQAIQILCQVLTDTLSV